MNAFALAFAYLRRRPLNTILNLLLLALGTGTIALLLLFTTQLEGRLVRDAAGIDLVVGAKGSPVQLILSAIYHMDVPTGNVLLSEADTLRQHPMIESVMPMALGDSYRGFRVVGTSHDYPAHYGAEIATGRIWVEPLEATIGALVAADAGLKIGDTFAGSHGLTEGGTMHGDHPYTVVGVLGTTGTVVDRLILTAVESAWVVHGMVDADHGAEGDDHAADDHEDHDEHDAHAEDGHAEDGHAEDGHAEDAHSDDAHDDTPLEITALLVKLASPMGVVTLPREINLQTRMQAALPAYEIARLLRLVGAGVDGFRAFAVVLVVSAALGIFTALYNALSERRYDIAVIRALGASRGTVLRQIVLEGLILSMAGVVLGLILGHAVAEIAGIWLWREYQLYLTGFAWVATELWLVVLGLVVGAIAALIPALQAYRIDISAVLAKG